MADFAWRQTQSGRIKMAWQRCHWKIVWGVRYENRLRFFWAHRFAGVPVCSGGLDGLAGARGGGLGSARVRQKFGAGRKSGSCAGCSRWGGWAGERGVGVSYGDGGKPVVGGGSTTDQPD